MTTLVTSALMSGGSKVSGTGTSARAGNQPLAAHNGPLAAAIADPARAPIEELLGHHNGPCVSIYLPTDGATDKGADHHRIAFKSLLKSAESSLCRKLDKVHVREGILSEPRGWEKDQDFWRHQGAGLAVFCAQGFLRRYRLPQPPPSLAIVADSFHVKPLIRLAQDVARFHLLCLSVERVALYEADSRGLVPVELHADVPRNMGQALGQPGHVTKARRSQYNFTEPDTKMDQLHRYFRRVDDAIWRRHCEPTGLPLMLAALPEYQTFYRQSSHHPRLLEAGIARDPFKDIDNRDLHALAMRAIEPVYQRMIDDLHTRYGEARSHHQGGDLLHEIARAAAGGQVEVLLLQDDHRIGGKIDPVSGEVAAAPIGSPAVDDALDDLAEMVFRHRGRVLVLPRGQMPTGNGVAAIYRFRMT
ncbi:MAG: hypothetical protein WD042_15690 [Phycisphaeraceae bacterium]